MKMVPEGDKVIVRPDDIDPETSGGILIPEPVRDQYKKASTIGTIVAMGPHAELRFSTDGEVAVNGEVGQRVIYGKYAGAEIRIERVEYRVIYDKDIVCLVEGEAENELPDSRKSMVA